MSASIAYRARSELLKADLQGASDVGLDGKDDRIYKQLLNEDREFEEIETPYGKLIKTEVLSTGFMLKYLCPFSWLYYVCMISSDFFNLMEKSLRDDVSPPSARIALYLDEVVPGNALRPDKAELIWQCIGLSLISLLGFDQARMVGSIFALCHTMR
jgi:hypothetical protein